MWIRLIPLTLAEWRHHPWRHAAALLAVALGVALASSVQWINHSALSEFAQAVRAVNGEPDLVLAADGRDGLPDELLDAIAADERVAVASPVVEIDTHARAALGPPRVPVRLIGIDALQVVRVAPSLVPRPASGAAITAAIDPGLVWLNPAARARLAVADGDWIELQSARGWHRLRVAGGVTAGGTPLAVIDIVAAQSGFDRLGRLSRIDIVLVTGVDAAQWLASRSLPGSVRLASADDAVQRVSNLSRAYRVNLGVLALVALLVGAFLVYSVVSLSVAQRTPQFALLGVLGLPAAARRRWILAEGAATGLAGSAIGLALGGVLAASALRWLGGDLGGGFFPGTAPELSWPLPMLAACFVLGTGAAVVGAWWPARQAGRMAPALALKGLGSASAARSPRWPALALIAGGGLLALLPPVAGLPLAAYASVALLLAGGVVAVPLVVRAVLSARAGGLGVLAWLAWHRARFARLGASATVAGVVASLALSVALTVMVESFRGAVSQWLVQVLPADLYARSAASAAAAEQASLPPGFADAVARLPGVARVQASRVLPLALDPRQPPVSLVARELDQPERVLPLVGEAIAAPAGEIGVYASEPAAAIHGWKVGQRVRLPLPGGAREVRVLGVWRDYARQFGAVAIDLARYRALTGDARLNDLAIWLKPGADLVTVRRELDALAGPDHPLDSASTSELKKISLAIFDRSFAVTRYLQVVAIGVGLVGVAASLSAQVLARRKEFGLLAHLGLTRRQVVALVGFEALAWLFAGGVVGLACGLAIAVVLVEVVNPQSFHWTMSLQVPAGRLALLVAAVLAAGVATAVWSARRAASRQAVLAVKEDW